MRIEIFQVDAHLIHTATDTAGQFPKGFKKVAEVDCNSLEDGWRDASAEGWAGLPNVELICPNHENIRPVILGDVFCAGEKHYEVWPFGFREFELKEGESQLELPFQ